MTTKKKTTKKVIPEPPVNSQVSNYAIPIGLLWVLISLAIGLGIVFITLSDKLDSLEQKITGQNQEVLQNQTIAEENKKEEKQRIIDLEALKQTLTITDNTSSTEETTQ